MQFYKSLVSCFKTMLSAIVISDLKFLLGVTVPGSCGCPLIILCASLICRSVNFFLCYRKGGGISFYLRDRYAAGIVIMFVVVL